MTTSSAPAETTAAPAMLSPTTTTRPLKRDKSTKVLRRRCKSARSLRSRGNHSSSSEGNERYRDRRSHRGHSGNEEDDAQSRDTMETMETVKTVPANPKQKKSSKKKKKHRQQQLQKKRSKRSALEEQLLNLPQSGTVDSVSSRTAKDRTVVGGNGTDGSNDEDYDDLEAHWNEGVSDEQLDNFVRSKSMDLADATPSYRDSEYSSHHRRNDGDPSVPSRRHSVDNSEHTRRRFWESAYRELQAELTSLRLDKRGLEAKVEKQAKALKKERVAISELEEERLDLQLDLVETRKVRDRLDRENNQLLKKLVKSEAENEKLKGHMKRLEVQQLQQQQQQQQNQDQQRNEGAEGQVEKEQSQQQHQEQDEQKEKNRTIKDIFGSNNLEVSPTDPRTLWSMLSEEVLQTPQSRSSTVSPGVRSISSRGLLGSIFSSAENLQDTAPRRSDLRPLSRMPQNRSFKTLRRSSYGDEDKGEASIPTL